ncbi:hypothetical protein MHSWG343_06760 [Candidatus Mycoplasma haematohominis]|uniref:Uncharacterized protein n=1 Tax=Candidatus Mycoplasma haematohominis TaxID=1494318 RepID=A0A478FTK8_9MOLU|nr:hypothetical protein MHSWG343_06760 [Candidatus Mycoplasma haemohominis]
MSHLLVAPFASSATFSLPLKAGLSIGLLGVSAITAGVSTWQNQSVSIDEGVKNVFKDTIPKFLKENLLDGGESIFKEYGNWKDVIGNDVLNTENPLLTKVTSWGGAIKGGVVSTEQIKSTAAIAEEANYYLFELGTIVGKVIEFVPTILIDSVTETALDPGKNGENASIGIQKIQSIIEDKGFNDCIDGLRSVFKVLSGTIEKITSSQANEVLNMFRNKAKNEIPEYLKTIKENTDEVQKDTEKYKDKTDELLTELFIGQKALQAFQSVLSSLISQLESRKTNGIKGVSGDQVTALSETLTNLKTKFSKK